MTNPFTNEPFTDFSTAENTKAMQKALADIKLQLGKSYPMWISGKETQTGQTFQSTNPANTEVVVGQFPKGTVENAEAAMVSAWKAFESWSQVPAKQRAEYFFRAAELMRQRKHQFSAWMVYEVGKNWPEADADTAEAIDFMEFYAHEMLRLSEPQPLTPVKGEKNELEYIPLGVGVVIPPWNFPLAICVGMASAALVTGNTVILKPASDSPTIAYKFVELLHEVGIPKEAIQFITGSGAVIGDYLVTHPKTRFISFTGSKEVGLRINELAAKHQSGQKWIKRIVAEMGGKDGILADETAHPEEVAKGIVAAAFGFQGQKCSACSRAIIHEAIYDRVLAKVVELTQQIKVGLPEVQGTQMGPVVSQSAKKKILEYIEQGKKEGKLLTGGHAPESKGHFIEPTVFEGIGVNDKLFQEEIFGPVLAFTKVKSFEEGLDLINATEFGLTGALYTNSRDRIELAKKKFHVGNLYFNRKCTGALVGAHPFGGFNMSGTDSKAGGRDYLLLFTQAKLMSEYIAK